MRNLIPIILGLFVVAAFLHVDFYFNIVYLLLAVYFLSRLWVDRSLHQLDVERRFVNRAFPGEEIPITLRLKNNGWIPVPWVKFHDSLPVNMSNPPFFRNIVSMGMQEEKRFDYTLSADRRGYYDVGPLQLYTGDLLGVVPQRSMQHASGHLIVYPRIVSLEALGLPTHSPLVALPAVDPLFEDPSRIMGVRPYVPGDSPRRIHWTATAATGELVVKRYQPAIARETLLCLDLDQESYRGRRRYDAVELAVVAAASLANHVIVQERLAVGLAVQAWDPLNEAAATFSLPPRRERGHLMNILEMLARVEVVRDASFAFPDFLRRESMRLPWGSTIVVITGREPAEIVAGEAEGETLLDSLVYLRRAGFAVVLVVIMPETTTEELERRAGTLGVPVYRVSREKELEIL